MSITYKGSEKPLTGPKASLLKNLHSSSKEHNIHQFVMPTYDAHVENLGEKTLKWLQIVRYVEIGSDLQKVVDHIEAQIAQEAKLEDQIHAFAVLKGSDWMLGFYRNGTDIKQETLGISDISSLNVYVNRRVEEGVIFVVSFKQADYPPKCSDKCNGNGECYNYPYSNKMGCHCKATFSGNKCNESGINLKLKSVLNSLLSHTMKLPTFASIQHMLEDTQMYLKTSSEDIKGAINKLEKRIEDNFRSMGEFMSKKFDWFHIQMKYKDAIENLNYFHSISKRKVTDFQEAQKTNFSDLFTDTDEERPSTSEDKDIAKFLLAPSGIQKWLYQINFLIVGRHDSDFNSHQPLLFMVMDKYKGLMCSEKYKTEMDRTFRQLMLLQLQGFMLWAEAFNSLNRDSSVIAKRYKAILKEQKKYLQNAICSVTIPDSTNFQDCSDGYYIKRSMKVQLSCKYGYFAKGKLFRTMLSIKEGGGG